MKVKADKKHKCTVLFILRPWLNSVKGKYGDVFKVHRLSLVFTVP